MAAYDGVTAWKSATSTVIVWRTGPYFSPWANANVNAVKLVKKATAVIKLPGVADGYRGIEDGTVQLYLNAFYGQNKAIHPGCYSKVPDPFWPVAGVETIYGGSADTWGTTYFTRDKLLNPYFAVAVAAENCANSQLTAYVDQTQVRAYWKYP